MLLKLCLVLLIGTSNSLLRNSKYKLEQVLILSRHNVRTPIGVNMDVLTPKTWPKWDQKRGYLTAKGALMEGYMGQYFYQWLNEQKVLPFGCPNEQEFYVHANSKQRTRASAEAFVRKAFPNCHIVVHHRNKTEPDPLFTPVVHNNTKVFAEIAEREMVERLSSLHLNDSFMRLENILDFKKSKICLVDKHCTLTKPSHVNSVVVGKKPSVSGGLMIGHSVVDTFVMQYYEGFPLKDVAWGQIKDLDEWYTLLSLQDGFHNIVFNTTHLAKDIAKPLINYISNTFKHGSPRIVLLVGHDANMLTVMNSLRFKAYRLPNQYEFTPVGSKIIFQKWFDSSKKKNLFRAEYVYQSTKQLRNSEELSLDNPPQSHVMELDGCKVDDQGFCSWDDFVKVLDEVVLSFGESTK